MSSLFPIDVASSLFLSTFIPNTDIKVYLQDSPVLPGNASNRKYVARAALPTMEWEHDQNGVWRQLHIPLEDRETVEFFDILRSVTASIINPSDLQPKLLRMIRKRCDHLFHGVSHRMALQKNNKFSCWAGFTAAIIEEIFNQVALQEAHVLPYAPYRAGEKGIVEAIKFLKNIYNEANSMPQDSLISRKGGYVEIWHSKKNRWLKYNQFSVRGQFLILSSNKSDDSLSLPLFRNGYGEFENTRFCGPLELGFLQEMGNVVDLPWFLDGDFSNTIDNEHRGIEIISPISSNSVKRISQSYGGDAWRLNPTGYSLLEFNSEIILSIASSQLKLKKPLLSDLDDWRRLAYDFPRSDQKVAKHQKSVAAFRNLREREVRNILKGEESDYHELLLKEISETNPLIFGEYMTVLLVLISLLKEWSSPACPHSASQSIIILLRKLGWVSHSDIIIPEHLTITVSKCIHTVCMWLESNGWNRLSGQEVRNQLINANRIIMNSDKISISCILDPERQDTGGGLGYLLRIIRRMFDEYYGFAGFCLGSLFKMNILSAYLMLGSNVFRQAILDLIHRRNAKWYAFKPLFWELND